MLDRLIFFSAIPCKTELYNKSNFGHSPVLLVKTLKFTYMNDATMENLFFIKFWPKKNLSYHTKYHCFIQYFFYQKTVKLRSLLKKFERDPNNVRLLQNIILNKIRDLGYNFYFLNFLYLYQVMTYRPTFVRCPGDRC